ncbi:hypothetical protein BJ138DRAFT_1130759 [Hygrophoropsis aurantiaca]|uniref:Uncharacterized protein n=1 Tax=Hygrophoropsis aurantiaca TaxID=72124 RepID=A0ACB7ZX30_9AGAM|nr:hypothetical protein BJ138DRAFT_1130759 [Hygrophoropsis aurantiaca]
MEKCTGDHATSVCTIVEIIENEVLELEKQESDLLAQLHLLRDTIARKRSLARNMKNSLVPVNRLPNEILLACFGQAVQDWADENSGADERAVAQLACDGWYSGWEKEADLELPCTPVLAISHVSHRWRQLTVNAPSLWTNIVVTPGFGRHMDVFRDVLRRAEGMPIAATFRFFEDESISSGTLLMEAIVSLIHARQINVLSFLDSGPVLSYLLSQMGEQAIIAPQTLPSLEFGCLTTLSIFGLDPQEGLTLGRLKDFLSAAPQLKTLELQHSMVFESVTPADETAVTLPMLENLTIIEASLFICIFLDTLSAPDLCQLKLLVWDPDSLATPCLFDDDNDSGLRVPKFPKLQNLTLSCTPHNVFVNTDFFGAFPRVTHLTLGTPIVFYSETKEAASLAMFRWLKHLTFDFAFKDAGDAVRHMDMRCCFNWLQKPKTQADRPLLISLLNRSTESMQNANLFRYYKELQQYGEFDAGSSRLNEFIRWQADGMASHIENHDSALEIAATMGPRRVSHTVAIEGTTVVITSSLESPSHSSNVFGIVVS